MTDPVRQGVLSVSRMQSDASKIPQLKFDMSKISQSISDIPSKINRPKSYISKSYMSRPKGYLSKISQIENVPQIAESKFDISNSLVKGDVSTISELNVDLSKIPQPKNYVSNTSQIKFDIANTSERKSDG